LGRPVPQKAPGVLHDAQSNLRARWMIAASLRGTERGLQVGLGASLMKFDSPFETVVIPNL